MSPCRHLGRWGAAEKDGAGTLIRQLGGGGGGRHRTGVTRWDHARGESRTRTPLPAPDFESGASAIPPLGRRLCRRNLARRRGGTRGTDAANSPVVAAKTPYPRRGGATIIPPVAEQLHWARLKSEAPYPLRRGAWYRVTARTPAYGVCPSCRHRAPLHGAPQILRCPRCNELFHVAWDELYLGQD